MDSTLESEILKIKIEKVDISTPFNKQKIADALEEQNRIISNKAIDLRELREIITI